MASWSGACVSCSRVNSPRCAGGGDVQQRELRQSGFLGLVAGHFGGQRLGGGAGRCFDGGAEPSEGVGNRVAGRLSGGFHERGRFKASGPGRF